LLVVATPKMSNSISHAWRTAQHVPTEVGPRVPQGPALVVPLVLRARRARESVEAARRPDRLLLL
tara:strand:+ start:1125 stop:1319 length:195 start_codon:yes stop_codon:yes gene_type:complete